MPKMHVDAEGRLQCPSHPHLITYNSPWPDVNGSPGGFEEPADGYVLHTEVGYEHSVEQEFNDPKSQASAFVSFGMDGHVHQYGPIGHGWKAWTQVGGNTKYRGAEHEDHGNPKNKFTPQQIESSASVLEAISAHDGFPLQVSDNPNGGKGVLVHRDGGAAWGGHNCPGDVREAQRPDIVHRAKELRGGSTSSGAITHPLSPLHALQRALHVPETGKWDHATDNAAEHVRHNNHSRSEMDCMAEQRAVGVAADGKWGPISQRNYRITVNRIQGILSVRQDAHWGPTTDRHFLTFRAAHS